MLAFLCGMVEERLEMSGMEMDDAEKQQHDLVCRAYLNQIKDLCLK